MHTAHTSGTLNQCVGDAQDAASLPEDIPEAQPIWDSVLSLYSTPDIHDKEAYPPVLSKILSCVCPGSLLYFVSSTAGGQLRKATLRDVLPTLSTILSSKDSDESISEQVLEIIGFDDIELVPEILADRANMARAVSTHDFLVL